MITLAAECILKAGDLSTSISYENAASESGLFATHPAGFGPINKYSLVISKFKVLSEILRDTRTLTYQICRIEEK